jgi:prepilin-type N-terminal cleavage/methylation domain-containing protein
MKRNLLLLWPERLRAQSRSSPAFSLIEVMCAVVILGTALVGLTQAITTALGSSKESELQTAAALLASGRIETLRAEGYFYDGVEEGQCGADLGQYQWRQTITSTAITGLHDVQVVIENSRTGKMIYELETLLFDASDFETASTPSNSDKSKKREGRER